MKFQDRLQRDMTTEIEQDETPTTVTKELLELGLIQEVKILHDVLFSSLICFHCRMISHAWKKQLIVHFMPL